MVMDNSFWNGKKVFITGHTGFKGSWLSFIISKFGGIVTGYSLTPSTQISLFRECKLENRINSVIGDIRDIGLLQKAFNESKPDIVFHLAAQPIVRESYREPRYTFETNIMGTVNILECIRKFSFTKSFLNITTDKVYKNNEWCWGYKETDELDGFEPYSNSKSCSELITNSYKRSFFLDKDISISTARAGNVIGGGDFSADRIIPDCIRAAVKGESISVRNPNSVRPYQHVLEPLIAYMMIAEKQYSNSLYSGNYNIGPDDNNCISTGELVDCFCKLWGEELKWEYKENENILHESNFLKLDISLVNHMFSWKPKWNIATSLEKTVEWFRDFYDAADISERMDKQIEEYLYER